MAHSHDHGHSHKHTHAQEDEGKLSPFLARQRYKAVTRYLTSDDVVLDLGCGSGRFGEYIRANSDNTYFGADTVKCWDGEPGHLFVVRVGQPLPKKLQKAGITVVTSLALIEHLSEPIELFKQAKTMLPKGGRFILTTPHPWAHHIHDFGSKVGLFSAHASDEHEDLLDEKVLRDLAEEAGFDTDTYKRFLLGMNQVAVFSRR